MTLPDWLASDEATAAPVLDEWAGIYGLDRALVYGLVSQESRFKPRAFLMDRNGGSYGLTQISLPTAGDLGYTGDGPGLYDPETNVQYGLLQLRNLLDQYGVWDQALSAYNCGYPTGCAAGDVYAADVENRAAYFDDVFNPPVDMSGGAGTTFDSGSGGALSAGGEAVGLALLLGLAWWASQR